MPESPIHAAIPHRPPFLFLDQIVSQSDSAIVCRKAFSGDEWFFAGHYPEYPLVPGVILCEAAMQAGAVLLAKSVKNVPGGVPVVTRMNDVRFKRMVRPSETVEIEVMLRERMADAFFLDAHVTCGGKTAVRFEFACKFVSRSE